MFIQSPYEWMRLDRFDLNLLVALHALFEERSVTRAAARLNITQPAMSAALRRLRDSFNDDLMVVSGKRMVPTPHAQSLAPLVSQYIGFAQSLISSSTLFDPSTSQRAFRIAASDYITTIVIRPMLAELGEIAPHVRIEIVPPQLGLEQDMDRGVIDCIIAPEQFQTMGHPQELLFNERHVLLGWSENPLFAAPITQEDYDSAGHVVVELSNTRVFAEGHVKARGYNRRIEFVATSFTIVPLLLPGTMRIALVHERLAKFFVRILPLAIAEPPFAIPPMPEMIQFHRTRTSDSGLKWLRERLHHHAELSAPEPAGNK